MAHVINVLPVEDPYLGALQWGGYVWSDTGTFRDPVTIRYFLSDDYASWTAREATAYGNALQSWANVANIRVERVFDAAQADLIEHNVASDVLDGDYGLHGTPMDAFGTNATYDGGLLTSTHTYAHGYFNYESFGWDYNDPNGGLNVGGNGYWTLIHELGHGLGLAHPHDDGGGSYIFPGVDDTWDTGNNGLNQGIWTVMSYVAYDTPSEANTEHTDNDTWSIGGNPVANYGYYAGPMAFDIAAIQDLYGTNTNFHNGFDTYTLPDQNQVGTYYTCIWDTGGTDSISYGGTRDVVISLRAATLDNSPTGGGIISYAKGIHGGFTIANGVVIENAYAGSGNDSLEGNQYSNYLSGGAGADRMIGWGGNDTYSVDNAGDIVEETANRGIDRVNVTLTTYTIPYQVEEVNYLGNATSDFHCTGNQLDNTMLGWAGNDTLNGLGGNDYMRGYGGNDTYSVSDVGDVVDEGVNGGTNDRVNTSLSSYTLGANVEFLDYTGLSTANFAGYGNELDNTLQGWNGNDRLDGRAGADIMRGYAGDDTFVVDNAGDQVVEYGGGGTDWVETSLTSYTLAANVENVNYLGVSTADFTGIGNELDNTILGWSGNDTLNGRAGADIMRGYSGNDTFIVDNAGDQVVEYSGGGSADRVNASVSYTLAAGVQVEILGTTSAAGTAAINLTGNELVQTLYGNAGANLLKGAGGADLAYGYGGNDTYVVDTSGDQVFEAAGGGTADRVNAAVSYTLAAGQQVEFLGTTSAAGTAAINLTGNEFAQTLYGNAGDNFLNGLGGPDTLSGFGGSDTFSFTTGLGAGNIDHITDFSAPADTIRLAKTIFSALSAGTLDATAYKDIGDPGATVDASDRILYNDDTGALYYDSNGSADGGRFQFAILDNKPATLTHADFVIAA